MITWIGFVQTDMAVDDVLTGHDPTHILETLRALVADRDDDPCIGVRRADVPRPVVEEQRAITESFYGLSGTKEGRGVSHTLMIFGKANR
jgi:hypothetical protein